MEAPDVVRLAGCEFPTKSETQQNQLAADEQMELERLQSEMSQWRSNRETELDRLVISSRSVSSGNWMESRTNY